MAHLPRARVAIGDCLKNPHAVPSSLRASVSLSLSFVHMPGLPAGFEAACPPLHSTPLIPFSPSLSAAGARTARQTDRVRPSVRQSSLHVRAEQSIGYR